MTITIQTTRDVELTGPAAEFGLKCALEFCTRAPWNATGRKDGCGYLSQPAKWKALVYRTPGGAVVVVLEAVVAPLGDATGGLGEMP